MPTSALGAPLPAAGQRKTVYELAETMTTLAVIRFNVLVRWRYRAAMRAYKGTYRQPVAGACVYEARVLSGYAVKSAVEANGVKVVRPLMTSIGTAIQTRSVVSTTRA